MARQKIIRRPNGYDYPATVCESCGTYAAKQSKTLVEKELDLSLGTCDICKAKLVYVGALRDFGFPTFYTYANGMPVN